MALPTPPLPHRIVPMTVAEYAAGPEDEEVHHELQEGVLVPMPSPTPEHQIAISELVLQLRAQLPADLRAVSDVDVDLRIVPPSRPGFVRRPDVAVVTRDGLARRRAEGGLLHAGEVVLAVELVSIGSERTDRVIERGEYADAGIGHYWLVELDDGPSLTACHLAGEFGYADAPPVRGRFRTDVPFPAEVDLADLE